MASQRREEERPSGDGTDWAKLEREALERLPVRVRSLREALDRLEAAKRRLQ